MGQIGYQKNFCIKEVQSELTHKLRINKDEITIWYRNAGNPHLQIADDQIAEKTYLELSPKEQ